MIEKIKELYKFIKDWFVSLDIVKRTILSSVLGSLLGASIIGFFNKYALFYYSLKQDFRVPIEGVEYINIAATLLYSVLIFGSLITYYIVQYSLDILKNVAIEQELLDMEKRANKATKLGLMIVVSFFIMIISIECVTY